MLTTEQEAKTKLCPETLKATSRATIPLVGGRCIKADCMGRAGEGRKVMAEFLLGAVALGAIEAMGIFLFAATVARREGLDAWSARLALKVEGRPKI